MKELVVVAIGGNSIIKDNASQSIEHQAEAVKAVADTVLEMLASDGNDSNLLIVFYVQIMPDDFVMQLHRF